MLLKKIIAGIMLAGVAPVLVKAQTAPQDKVTEAMRSIQRFYVDSLSTRELSDAAIRGMVTALDPHSKYFNKAEAEAMQSAMRGSFVGIGIEYMMQHDTVYVTQILPDGPAETAGLIPGDRILKIDGENVAGTQKTNLDIMKKIRGVKNTKVELVVYRPLLRKELVFSISRGAVADHSVTAAYMIDSQTGYMAIRIFSQSTRDEVENALKKLKAQGMSNLILDLQGNGGGYVEAAIGVADEFLKRNQLVYYTVPQDKGKDYYYASQSGTSFSGKLVVLIDQATASASEILAGALQDWDRAVLVGRRSYGKGLTQRPIPLSDGSVLEMTGARLYTPAGRSVQKPYKGVNYQADIANRYKSGELFHEMNLPKPDSLKVKTLVNKRAVYGGGGITPDKFVPLDTLQESYWLKSIAAAGLVNNASWQIADKQRAELKKQYPDINTFSSKYNVPKSIINDVVSEAKKKGFVPDNAHKKRLIELLALEIKGQVAGQVFGGNEYYLRIINAENTSIQEALKILKNQQEYTGYLEGKITPGADKKAE